MSASQAQLDANRKNAQKSTGPRTAAGKNIAKYNGMSHGLTAKTAVLTTEDAAAYEQRMIDIERTLGPRNAVEKLLAAQASHASFVYERAVRIETARLSASIDDAQAAEIDEIDSLFNRLFHDARYPNVISGAIPWDHIGPRTSHCGLANNPDDPAKLVRKILSSVLGCERMLEHWSALRALLEPGRSWQGNHKLMAVRMLGRQPTDMLNSREIADIYVACWSIDSKRQSPYSEMRSDLGRTEYKHFVRRVRGTWTDMMNACDQENSRRVLVGIVEGAIARVKVKAAEAQARAERDAARRADCLSFDGSREAELLRRYAASNHRQFIRSLNEFVKIRRATDEVLSEPELQVDERVPYSEEDCRGESDVDWSCGDQPPVPMRDDANWSRRDHAPEAPPSQGGEWDCEEPVSASPITIPHFPVASDPIDSSLVTGSSATIDRDATTDPTDRTDPEMITSITSVNLRTEPDSRCAAAPSNPGVAGSEPEPDGLAAVATQYERNGSEQAGVQIERDNHDVTGSQTESISHGVAGSEAHSTRRPFATELLLPTIVLLSGLVLWADHGRRVAGAERRPNDPSRRDPRIGSVVLTATGLDARVSRDTNSSETHHDRAPDCHRQNDGKVQTRRAERPANGTLAASA